MIAQAKQAIPNPSISPQSCLKLCSMLLQSQLCKGIMIGIRDDNPPIMDNIIPVQPSTDMKLFSLNPKPYFDNVKSFTSKS